MTEQSIGRPKREVSDTEFIEAVYVLHPTRTNTGGVKASQIAEHLELSTRRARTRLKHLHEKDQIKRLAGLRGPTYAPLIEEQST